MESSADVEVSVGGGGEGDCVGGAAAGWEVGLTEGYDGFQAT